MNTEQAKSSVRWFVGAFGGGIAGFVAGKGWASAETVTAVITSEAFLSGVATVAMLIWALITHKEQNAIAVVDTMAKDKDSPVKGVVLSNTIAGFDLAKSIPGSTTVVAGTPEAKVIAAKEVKS